MGQTKEAVGKRLLKRGHRLAKKLNATAKGRQRVAEHATNVSKILSSDAAKNAGNRTLEGSKNALRKYNYEDAVGRLAFKKESMNKEAVGNIGEEEMNFVKHVRLTREDTRRDANALFSKAHQSRERDRKLVEKLFLQAPGAVTMAPNLQKEAFVEQWEHFEKIKVAYNVHHFFESGAHMTPAQRRFPELMKVAKARPVVSMKKVPAASSTSGETSGSTSLSASQA